MTQRFAIGAVLLCTALLAAGSLVVVRTERALLRSRSETAQETTIGFDLDTLRQTHTGFSPLGEPSAYTTGVEFQGKAVLGGGDGLTIGVPGGPGSQHLRAGVELPAAPIVGLAVGVVRGSTRPELVVATRGEGVLFLDDADGGAVRQLRPNEAALRDVTAVAVLASGDLLIGTRMKGLLRYDGKALVYFSPALTGIPITALATDGAEFWAGTRNRGVFHWHAGQADHFGVEAGMPDDQVESIALKQGTVFVGTPLGVAEFDDGKPVRVLAKGVFAHALALDKERLLVGSIDEGILKIPLSEGTRGRGESSDGLRAESFLTAGDALFAVTTGGLMRSERGGGWTAVRDSSAPFTGGAPVLADRNVSALSFGPDGALWVGYFDRGLDVVNLPAGTVRHTEDDHVFCVNRIAGDAGRGTMDVATANGLVLFDAAGRERQVMLRRDGLIADQVTDVAFTRNGTVLATPAGLTFIDAGGVSSLYGFQGLVNNHVYALASDAASGTLLAGTLGGISVLSNTVVLRDAAVRRNLTTKNSGLKQNWITAIVSVPDSDARGAMRWFVGTYGGGVVELGADGEFTAMEGATRAMEVNPNAMLVTERHVLAGSLGEGLFVYDRAIQRWSQVKAGLPSLNVTAMTERDGELYVGTENGVVHIAEARLAP